MSDYSDMLSMLNNAGIRYIADWNRNMFTDNKDIVRCITVYGTKPEDSVCLFVFNYNGELINITNDSIDKILKVGYNSG